METGEHRKLYFVLAFFATLCFQILRVLIFFFFFVHNLPSNCLFVFSAVFRI